MAEDLDLPDEIFGFGSWLLWLIATRATDLVDQMYETGPPRRSQAYGTVEGHHVPTPSLIAWMLTAAEAGLPPQALARRDPRLDDRQKILRTLVSRAIGQDARLFRDSWLHVLALQCGFSDAELDLLLRGRDERFYPVEPQCLRDAIAETFRSRPRQTARASQPAAVFRTLPRPSPAFTGRERELQQLAAAIDTGQADVHVIGGMAGVGKSAFAVHAARQLSGRFPDGHVVLQLRGHTPGLRPADPADALAGLLIADGVAAAHIRSGLEARADQWRERLAGRRLVMILDDAVSTEQVRPLLPSTDDSLVMITSRRRLTALEDAHTINLDILPPDETALLIARLAGRPSIGAGDPATAELARLCGYLPLAAGLMGRKLQHHPAWTPADLAADLATARGRLQLMTAENVSVAAAFELSYADLSADQQRLFRRLAEHPGTEIDAWAAAALDGSDAHAARHGLDALYDHYLLAEPIRGRYVFHDLVCDYAGSLAAADSPGERETATDRLLDYYLHTARAASRQISQRARATAASGVPAGPDGRSGQQSPVAAPTLAGRADAIAWMDAERLSLGAAASRAADLGRPGHATAIPAAMHVYLCASGHWDQGLALHSAALTAARRSGNQQAEAAALRDLGELQRMTSDLAGATASQTAALEVCRELGDLPGETDALLQLGWLEYLTDDYASSAEKLTTALELFRSLGDRHGEAEALGHLGYLHYVNDQYSAATECLTSAMEIWREVGDQAGQLGTLNYLAHVQHQTGQYLAASEGLRQALEICQAEGNQRHEAGILTTLGYSQRLTGQFTAALASLTRAVDLHRPSGNRLGEANALNYLGLVQRLSGDHEAAIAHQELARDLYRGLGTRLGEANALQELGIAQQGSGNFSTAAATLDAALRLYQEIGEQLGEAETLSSIGDLMVASDRAPLARQFYERALAIARPVTAPLEQAHALAGLGECLLRDGQAEDGVAALREAAATYRDLGSPDAQRLETLLHASVRASISRRS
jgi:tetratricopeptide (TPR) repeat protein